MANFKNLNPVTTYAVTNAAGTTIINSASGASLMGAEWPAGTDAWLAECPRSGRVVPCETARGPEPFVTYREHSYAGTYTAERLDNGWTRILKYGREIGAYRGHGGLYMACDLFGV